MLHLENWNVTKTYIKLKKKSTVDIIKYNTSKEMLHNQINLSKHILHFKLSSSLKKGSTIIIWTEQIVSGHKSFKGLKPMYLIILWLFLYINWERKMFPV